MMRPSTEAAFALYGWFTLVFDRRAFVMSLTEADMSDNCGLWAPRLISATIVYILSNSLHDLGSGSSTPKTTFRAKFGGGVVLENAPKILGPSNYFCSC